jgi:glycine hydroxymethyltransferase
MKEPEMAVIGRLIGEALDSGGDEAKLARVKGQVRELAIQFPLYASRLK